LRIPWSLTIPDALRATEKDANIAQYRAFTIPDALRVPEKKFPIILVRGSQSYLSWFIVSLLMTMMYVKYLISCVILLLITVTQSSPLSGS